jgi:integrase
MSKRRGHGEGSIDERGPDQWRLRYRVDGKRYTVAFHGTLGAARAELRRVLKSGDDGEHVAPDKVTVAAWVDRWLELLARQPEGEGKRKRGLVNQRSIERYSELLHTHVVPALGHRPLQKVTPTELDNLYGKLEQRLAVRTVLQIHYVLKSCLAAAVRKNLLITSPVDGADVPQPDEADHGMALDRDQLLALVKGFKKTPIYEIIAVAAFTGMRRNEILALRWTDIDFASKTIKIERSLERTEKFGTAFKEPKTWRGKRTITVDDATLALLAALRNKYLCIQAGVPDSTAVNLSLVKLPTDALVFPSLWPAAGERITFTKPREPNNVSQKFIERAAKLGHPGMRFHDLRGSHVTVQLNAGVPLHVVAERCGHDPAVMLRAYAKHTKKADEQAAAVMSELTKGLLQG